MKTFLIATLLMVVCSAASARTWKYSSEDHRHIDLTIQDWNGQFRISGSLYYNDGVGLHEALYDWDGLIERLPNGRFSENKKIVVKRANVKFTSGGTICMVPIEVILYLTRGDDKVNGIYIESKIPLNNIHPIKDDPNGRCQAPQYFWVRDPNPYWITESRQ